MNISYLLVRLDRLTSELETISAQLHDESERKKLDGLRNKYYILSSQLWNQCDLILNALIECLE